jgi:Uma2 family endonuclease
MRPVPADIPYTYDDYRLLPDDGRRYELIDGDLFVTPAPTPFHQTVSRRLQHALIRQLEEPGIAYIFNAPCDVILTDTTVVQPDLALVRIARKEIITQRGIEGAPEVVVEILSPSTRERDRYIKRAAYARQAIPEYWIVDPDQGWIEVHRLAGQGYHIHDRFDRAATLASPAFPEVAVPLAPLFAPH